MYRIDRTKLSPLTLVAAQATGMQLNDALVFVRAVQALNEDDLTIALAMAQGNPTQLAKVNRAIKVNDDIGISVDDLYKALLASQDEVKALQASRSSGG